MGWKNFSSSTYTYTHIWRSKSRIPFTRCLPNTRCRGSLPFKHFLLLPICSHVFPSIRWEKSQRGRGGGMRVVRGCGQAHRIYNFIFYHKKASAYRSWSLWPHGGSGALCDWLENFHQSDFDFPTVRTHTHTRLCLF